MENKRKAVLLMLVSSLAFAGSAAAVKLSGDLPVFEKVFFRNILAVLIAYVTIRRKGDRLWGERQNRLLLFFRSLLGVMGMAMYFYAIRHLFLADSAILHKLFPFFVTIFAAFFLKEKLTRIQIPGMVIAFLASMLIIKPTFDYSILPALAGFGTALLSGATYTMVRYLRNKETPATIVFFFSFTSLVLLSPLILLDFKMPTPVQWIYLLLIGIFAAAGQFSLTYAYRYGKASEIAVYNYVNILFAAFLGFMIWREIPDLLSIIGGLIIIAISVIIFLYNLKHKTE